MSLELVYPSTTVLTDFLVNFIIITLPVPFVQEYLEENEEVTFDIFLEKVWDNIHEIYRRPQDETKETETETDSANLETPDVSFYYV